MEIVIPPNRPPLRLIVRLRSVGAVRSNTTKPNQTKLKRKIAMKFLKVSNELGINLDLVTRWKVNNLHKTVTVFFIGVTDECNDCLTLEGEEAQKVLGILNKISTN